MKSNVVSVTGAESLWCTQERQILYLCIQGRENLEDINCSGNAELVDTLSGRVLLISCQSVMCDFYPLPHAASVSLSLVFALSYLTVQSPTESYF